MQHTEYEVTAAFTGAEFLKVRRHRVSNSQAPTSQLLISPRQTSYQYHFKILFLVVSILLKMNTMFLSVLFVWKVDKEGGLYMIPNSIQ